MKHCTKCESTTNPFGKDRSTPDGLMRICKPCVNQRNRAYAQSKAGRFTNNEAKRRWKLRNPKKYNAQRIVAKAKLEPQPCACGETNDVSWHHDDYDKPLEVRPLCAQCHRDWHVEHGEALNPR